MGKRVLVVDDSSTVRQEVSAALQKAGFEVLMAVDGVDGVAKVNDNDDLAAVVADINMPRMDGLEMLARIKSDAKNAALPVLMLTTEGQPELIQQAKSAGAKGWIVKPFKADFLVAALRKVTGQ